MKATKAEEKWIKELKQLMKRKPKSIWFFSKGELHIMKSKNNQPVYCKDYGGVDYDYKIDEISNKILFEGGIF